MIFSSVRSTKGYRDNYAVCNISRIESGQIVGFNASIYTPKLVFLVQMEGIHHTKRKKIEVKVFS